MYCHPTLKLIMPVSREPPIDRYSYILYYYNAQAVIETYCEPKFSHGCECDLCIIFTSKSRRMGIDRAISVSVHNKKKIYIGTYLTICKQSDKNKSHRGDRWKRCVCFWSAVTLTCGGDSNRSTHGYYMHTAMYLLLFALIITYSVS